MVSALRRPDSSPLAAPFVIGRVTIPNRVVLAPMAGLSSSAYRRHMKAHGAGLVTTEMVSAYGLTFKNARTDAYLDFVPEERPIAVQLFGDSPEVMARATAALLARDAVPDLIDINMGCPVRKVVKTGAGAALLGDPDRAVAVAAAVVGAAASSGVPVTVKLRSGLRDGERTAVGLAPRLEEAGVQALGVHPRAATQFYRGRADHAVTAAVVEAVDVPVIASGDVDGVEQALAIVADTGAVAVMVARGAAGDPWLIGRLLACVEAPRPPLPVVVADLRALLRLAAEERGQERAARWLRKALSWYLRPSGVSAASLAELRAVGDAEALDAALAALVRLEAC